MNRNTKVDFCGMVILLNHLRDKELISEEEAQSIADMLHNTDIMELQSFFNLLYYAYRHFVAMRLNISSHAAGGGIWRIIS